MKQVQIEYPEDYFENNFGFLDNIVPKGKMSFQLGHLKSKIWGGPYLSKPDTHEGVKMALEIDKPCTVDIPTRDFQVPDETTFKQGLVKGIMLIACGKKLYVGCMGGVGRTGLYMAGLAKVMSEYRKTMHRPGFDPILYVRTKYVSHAIETQEQQDFINTLDVDDIVDWWFGTQRMLYTTPVGSFTVPERKPIVMEYVAKAYDYKFDDKLVGSKVIESLMASIMGLEAQVKKLKKHSFWEPWF